MKFFNFKSSFIAAILLTSISAFSQSIYKNGVFLELGGNAVVYSLNYERQFSKGFIGRIGATYITEDIAIPVLFGKVFGSKTHHFELSLGFDYVNYNTKYYDVSGNLKKEPRYNALLITGFVGYRYQKPEKRFFFRIGFTPIWRNIYSEDTASDSPSVLPWAGVSVGYRF